MVEDVCIAFSSRDSRAFCGMFICFSQYTEYVCIICNRTFVFFQGYQKAWGNSNCKSIFSLIGVWLLMSSYEHIYLFLIRLQKDIFPKMRHKRKRLKRIRNKLSEKEHVFPKNKKEQLRFNFFQGNIIFIDVCR